MSERRPLSGELPDEHDIEEAFDRLQSPESPEQVSRDIAFDSEDGRTTVVIDENQVADQSSSESAGAVELSFGFPSVQRTLGGEGAGLTASDFASSVDDLHPTFDKVLNDVEAIVKDTSAKDLVALVGGRIDKTRSADTQGVINYTVLLRLLERYAQNKAYKNNSNFFKIVEVLRAIDKLDYNLSEHVSLNNDSPRSYYVLRKIAYILNSKSPKEILKMVRSGGINPYLIAEVGKRYQTSKSASQDLKNKVQAVIDEQSVYEPFYDVEDMIDESLEDQKALLSLLQEKHVSLDTVRGLLEDYNSGARRKERKMHDYKKALETLLRDPNSTSLLEGI